MTYERIRNLREDNDLFQKELAEYLKCSQVTYSRYELGKRDIPTDVLKKLANYFNTSIDYLLDETDVKKPYPKRKRELKSLKSCKCMVDFCYQLWYSIKTKLIQEVSYGIKI